MHFEDFQVQFFEPAYRFHRVGHEIFYVKEGDTELKRGWKLYCVYLLMFIMYVSITLVLLKIWKYVSLEQ